MTLDEERLLGALIALATALFLMAVSPRFRYRRAAKIGAIALYGALAAGAVVYVVLWLFGMSF